MKKFNFKKIILMLFLILLLVVPVSLRPLKIKNSFSKTGSNWLSKTLGNPNEKGEGVFSFSERDIWLKEKIKETIKEKFSFLSAEKINSFLETLEIDYENLYLTETLGSNEKLSDKKLFEVLNGEGQELQVFVKVKRVFSSDQGVNNFLREFRLPLVLRRETTYSSFQEVEIRLFKNYDEIPQKTVFINEFNFLEIIFFLKDKKVWEEYLLLIGEKEKLKVKLKTFEEEINGKKEELPVLFMKKGSKFVILNEVDFMKSLVSSDSMKGRLFFGWTWGDENNQRLNYIPVKVEYIIE